MKNNSTPKGRELKSNCCDGSMTVITADEGTAYYVCNVCKIPCDPKFDSTQKEEKFCMRCGMTEKEARKDGSGCRVYGTDYRTHKYMTESTPSEGWDWENELLKKLRRNVDLDLDWIFPYIHKVIYEVKQEDRRKIIDKAQQEITDWSLERQEKAYRMGIDIGRQEERREIQKDIKSVLNLLDGDTPKNKIANYIREYLEEE